MKLLIQDNCQAYLRAENAFTGNRYSSSWNSAQDYWDDFGYANNMKVIITQWNGPYPVVEALEFNTEADYVWFMLRWS
jgi:hypothetical protein